MTLSPVYPVLYVCEGACCVNEEEGGLFWGGGVAKDIFVQRIVIFPDVSGV